MQIASGSVPDGFNSTEFDDFYKQMILKIQTVKDHRLPNSSIDEYKVQLDALCGNIGYKTELTNDEELIFKSYFEAIDKGDSDKVKISLFYIEEVQKMNLPHESVIFITSRLSMFKNIYESEMYRGSQNYVRIHDDCYKRGCFDCCMYKRFDALEKSNFVEKALFIIGIPESFLAYAGICGWDCVTN